MKTRFFLAGSLLLLLSGGPTLGAPPLPAWYRYQRARYKSAPALKQAALAEGRGDLTAARTHIEEAVAQAPDNVALRRELLELCGQTGNWEKALDVATHLLVNEPSQADLLSQQGEAAYQLGEMELASDALRAAYEALPESAPERAALLPHLTQATHAAGRLPEAAAYARRWVEVQPTAEASVVLVAEAVAREDWALATQWAEQAANLTEDGTARGERLLELGYLRTRSGNLAGAAEAFAAAGQSAAEVGQRSEAQRQQGQTAYRQGHYEEAARHFKAYLLETFDENIARGYLSALNLSGQHELAALEAASFLTHDNGSPEFRATLEASRPTGYWH